MENKLKEKVIEILNGLKHLKHDKHFNRHYWVKNDVILFEQDFKFGWLVINNSVFNEFKKIDINITTKEICELLKNYSDLCEVDDSCYQVRANKVSGKYEKLQSLLVLIGNDNKSVEWNKVINGESIKQWFHV